MKIFPLVIAMQGVALVGCNDPKQVVAAQTNAPVHAPLYLTNAQPRLPTIKLFVGGEELITELAVRQVEIYTGMMWRTNMPENEAMLFVFGTAQPRGFYMRNTRVPLSLAYISTDGVIQEIHDLHPLNETSVPSRADNVQFVLEVPQGWFKRHNIAPGTLLSTSRGELRKNLPGTASAMSRPTDVRVVATRLYFLPVITRVPLKFGTETTTSVTCARVCVTVQGHDGRRAEGWGETPLSVQWVWPSKLPYAERHERLKSFVKGLAQELVSSDRSGHPIEIGAEWQEYHLPHLLWGFNRGPSEPMPVLAGLVCLSLFDVALHDAFGNLHQRSVYSTYTGEFMSHDLGDLLKPTLDLAAIRRDAAEIVTDAEGWQKRQVHFSGKFPTDFLVANPPQQLLAWHLVGGLDPIDESELTGREPDDGYPVLLRDWIRRDGLKCLKIKLRGNDSAWDYARLNRVGDIAREEGVPRLTADFNCTVTEPAYVNEILDQLQRDARDTFDRLLYVEQPFPYELEEFPIDVHSVSRRKPLFLDESAHNWKLVRRGRELGWTGVALKTCKTQTGALLTACWAKAHGMQLMVQDLTNPMLAQIPHVLLAAHVGTIAGVETNAMQFYPDASLAEEAVHPGLYRRRNGTVDLSSLGGPGFGYRLAEVKRELPAPVAEFGK